MLCPTILALFEYIGGNVGANSGNAPNRATSGRPHFASYAALVLQSLAMDKCEQVIEQVMRSAVIPGVADIPGKTHVVIRAVTTSADLW